ncbi:nuclear transport factor 2 family protein [Mesorhizobium sp. SP-1A]|uniref:nuclear transport factor 2 family protein n=1 Tax=Mesorhizobium sp. SP-1A TaxID=3077840 RepID=UPI0028F6ECB7|nr:nuclear transport factor 2 family protein [Mesorhizobium sp. SP-1A]
MAADLEDDSEAVRLLVARQFASLSWNEGRTADWDGFSADFLPGAMLFPAARPVASRTVPEFVARMKHLSTTTLPALEEEVRGMRVTVFGNVAVAAVACAVVENHAAAEETVEMMLLVKNEGRWRIAAQAWDKAGPDNPVPDSLLGSPRPDRVGI